MSAYSTSIACILRGNEESAEAAGTAIVLDVRRVLTCAHVINEALGRPCFAGEPPTGAVIMVTVPLRRSGETAFTAEIVPELWWPPLEDPKFGEPEDIAVLELRDDATFPADVAAARLIELDLRDVHNRRVWLTGFPGGGPSDRIIGLIHGLDNQGRVQVDPDLERRVVTGGFSGAGI